LSIEEDVFERFLTEVDRYLPSSSLRSSDKTSPFYMDSMVSLNCRSTMVKAASAAELLSHQSVEWSLLVSCTSSLSPVVICLYHAFT